MAEPPSPKKRGIHAAASLTDDLVVEILARLPVKSVIRFRCVCKAWRSLISDAGHRKKLPQTLAGFFYSSLNFQRSPASAVHFTNVSGRGIPLIDPSLDFLPKHGDMMLLDCCNGLLLCSSSEDVFDLDLYHYFVCNPATKEWTALPDSGPAGRMRSAHLGFDPAVSPHFHVFKLVEVVDEESELSSISGVELYSSETGEWVHEDSGWSDDIDSVDNPPVSVFLDGCLHFLTRAPSLATVDTEGKIWRNIPVPEGWRDGFIRQSQGQLHYANFESHYPNLGALQLAIYVLEDNGDSHEWILKHSVMSSDIFGGMGVHLLGSLDWVAIHPECSLIFFTVGASQTLMSYDMNLQKVERIRDLGYDSLGSYLQYVPLYSELEALHI